MFSRRRGRIAPTVQLPMATEFVRQDIISPEYVNSFNQRLTNLEDEEYEIPRRRFNAQTNRMNNSFFGRRDPNYDPNERERVENRAQELRQERTNLIAESGTYTPMMIASSVPYRMTEDEMSIDSWNFLNAPSNRLYNQARAMERMRNEIQEARPLPDRLPRAFQEGYQAPTYSPPTINAERVSEQERNASESERESPRQPLNYADLIG